MRNVMKRLNILMIVSALALSACQQQGATPTTPVAPPKSTTPPLAKVNDEVIEQSFFDSYSREIAGKSASELTAELRERALDNLIRGKLAAQQAIRDGLDKDPAIAAQLELARLNVLQQALSERFLKDKTPTDAQLRAEYETQVAAMPQQQFRARHILVATEPFAQKIITQLKQGADFASLAKRESMDSSKEAGGDLNWFGPNDMVKPFADAVAALKPGQYTQAPVQTQYGWHVIKLEETRPVATPPFDQVRGRLLQIVQGKAFKTYTDDLLKTAKIERPGAPAAPADKPAAKSATPPSP
jgi:peptidyl-prolyl cis-trans isomerase C